MRTNCCFFSLLFMISMILTCNIAFAEISEDARRHFDRGAIAVEVAETDQDLETAVKEFQAAIRLAPEWPDAHYNLAVIYEKLARLGDAAFEFRRYIELAPKAADAVEIKSRINKLEFLIERESEKARIPDLLEGEWNGAMAFCGGHRTSLKFYNWGNGEVSVELPINWNANPGVATDTQRLPVEIKGNKVKFSFRSKLVVPQVMTSYCDIEYELSLVEPSVLKGDIHQKGSQGMVVTLTKRN
ncbi:MAG: tetratricopeptide repeat protein [Deltaproteobacteria bacterium]|nr:tetratricopeptide repeat protein [Deltaproteobacteria bacterium]